MWRTYAPGPARGDGRARRGAGRQRAHRRFHPASPRRPADHHASTRARSPGCTLAFLGDAANNMAHSYLLGGATAGHARPGQRPGGLRSRTPTSSPRAQEIAAEHRRLGAVRRRPGRGASTGADVVITDTWVSMGKEDEAEARAGAVRRLRARRRRCSAHADADAIVLHCLPAYRGKEIAAEVIDGPQSVVWDEAENRLHAQKALLVWLLEQHEAMTHERAHIPLTKTARQQLIVDLLGQHAVRSQPSSPTCSPTAGVVVTQATLSRDLVELDAVKVRAASRRARLRRARRGRRPHARGAARARGRRGRLARLLRELLVSAPRRQRQPRRAAHPARRRPVPGLRHRPGRAAATSSAPSPATTPSWSSPRARRRRRRRRSLALTGLRPLDLDQDRPTQHHDTDEGTPP